MIVTVTVLLAAVVAASAYLILRQNKSGGTGSAPAAIGDPGQHLDQPGQPDGPVPCPCAARARVHAHRPERAAPVPVALPRQGRRAGVHGPALHRHLPDRLAGVHRRLPRPRARWPATSCSPPSTSTSTTPRCSTWRAYSREQRLTTIPDWHFFTGPVPAPARRCGVITSIQVQAPSPDADIVHTSAVYFIDPAGPERYLAAPMADHTTPGRPTCPPGRSAAWGQGIALVARPLAR